MYALIYNLMMTLVQSINDLHSMYTCLNMYDHDTNIPLSKKIVIS